MNSFLKYIVKLGKQFIKTPIWCKLLLALSILLIITCLINVRRDTLEGFKQKKKFLLKKGNEVYDEFYVSVYDDLLQNQVKNVYEIGEIVGKTSLTSESRILDIGSGTGHHVHIMKEKGLDVKGVDVSPVMVAKAIENYPQHKDDFKIGDVNETMMFAGGEFTHITCLYFTVYSIQDKRLFFDNCFHWLMPGGYMVVHMVDREKFDPMVPAGSPFAFVSPQKYAEKRITESTVHFNDFKYKSHFEEIFPNDVAIFREVFKDKKTGHVRQNEHTLYMPTQKKILFFAKDSGFILLGKSEMTRVGYENQYLYILQKPN